MSENRLLVNDDWKNQVIDLGKNPLPLPPTGIYDSPVRYYKANEQWAKVIEGFLNWLTETTAWKDAEDEDYIGIQAVLTFLEGVDIVAELQGNIRWNNCVLEILVGQSWIPVQGYDETCFTSESELTAALAPLQSNIAQNASDIAQNTAAINNNTSAINSLTSQVTTNTGNIAQNTSDIASIGSLAAQNASDIANNTSQINSNAGNIAQNASDIANNDSELANHETRITALENSSGGGGGEYDFTYETVRIVKPITTLTLPSAANGITLDNATNPFQQFDTIRIRVRPSRAAGSQLFSIYFNGDYTVTNYAYTANHSSGTTQSYIGQVSVDEGWYDIVITNIEDGKLTQARSAGAQVYWVQNAYVGGHFEIGYKLDDLVDTIEIILISGQFDAGSSFEIWGEIEQEIVVAATPITQEWEAYIDFRVTDAAAIIQVAEGLGYQGDHYEGDNGSTDSGLGLFVQMGETREITRVVMEYYVESGASDFEYTVIRNTNSISSIPSWAEADPIVYDAITGLDTGDISGVADNETDEISLYVYTFDNGVTQESRCYSVRIWGNGTIPTALAPYEI